MREIPSISRDFLQLSKLLTLVSRFELKGIYSLEDLTVDLAMVSTAVGIALTYPSEEDTKVVFAMLAQLLSFALPFLDGPFSQFDLSD